MVVTRPRNCIGMTCIGIFFHDLSLCHTVSVFLHKASLLWSALPSGDFLLCIADGLGVLCEALVASVRDSREN